jgi:hypothetical protein
MVNADVNAVILNSERLQWHVVWQRSERKAKFVGTATDHPGRLQNIEKCNFHRVAHLPWGDNLAFGRSGAVNS